MENENNEQVVNVAQNNETMIVANNSKIISEPYKYLVYALLFDVVGFGACMFTIDSGLLIVAAIVYLCAAYFAVLSIVKVFNQKHSTTHRIIVTILGILGILIGGSGLYFGVVGFLFSLDGGVSF